MTDSKEDKIYVARQFAYVQKSEIILLLIVMMIHT